jgi:hypothetical protein
MNKLRIRRKRAFQRNKDFPPLPKEYETMEYALAIDPPAKNGEVKAALDVYTMAVAYIGAPAWSDNLIGRCFATAICNGFPEFTVLTPMRVPLLVGSYRFGIRGGCVPDFALIRKFVVPYTQEMARYKKKTPWLKDLMQRYNITGWEQMPFNYFDDKSAKRFFSLRRMLKLFPKKRQ